MSVEKGDIVHSIIEKAEKILLEYPLCNSCLGRLFAKYGVGLSNYDRGIALKTLLAMKLHYEYLEKQLDKQYLSGIASNAGESIASLYLKMFNEQIAIKECFICGNKFNRKLIEEIASIACSKLRDHDARSFIVGVTFNEETINKELEIMIKHGFESTESIRREFKREIGKTITTLCGLYPDFAKPDAVVMVKIDKNFKYEMEVKPNPIFYTGYYWKLGRRISHIPWFTKTGGKKYPLSVQEVVEKIFREVFVAEKVVIHAAGREDVDARMIGTGRPLIVEIKVPRIRRVDLSDLKSRLNKELSSLPVKLDIVSLTSKTHIAYVKEHSGKKKKVYRVVVYSEGDINLDEIETLEKFFEKREVKQRTPTRILKRKKDKEKSRRVHSVKIAPVSKRVFEALVYCDGGLYVKELVHCDNGRTTPCFANVLGRRVIPIELDVIYVEE